MTPKQRQTKKKTDQEQEHIHMNGHNDPRLLEIGRRESSSSSKDTASLPCCQASGRDARILHHRETLYPSAVLLSDMVDNSTNPLQTPFGPVFGDEVVQRGLFFPE